MLGDGTTQDSTTPMRVSNISGALGVSAGGYDACALLSSGIDCWGDNFYDELGQSGFEDTDVPVAIPTVIDAIAVADGDDFTCALLSNRTVECWGVQGPGYGTPPAWIAGLTNVAAVSSGTSHACALLTDGSLRCWGNNGSGQLGNGTVSPALTTSLVPGAVMGIVGKVTAVAAGSYATCALLEDTTVDCWGDNTYGELGNGAATPGQPGIPTPAKVPGLTGVTSISAGNQYICAVLVDHTAACWGRNDEGYLGNGTMTTSPVPVPVSGLTNVAGLVTGLTRVRAAPRRNIRLLGKQPVRSAW
jgi:alpha-tubulin suppressor-like RCC1 family protein